MKRIILTSTLSMFVMITIAQNGQNGNKELKEAKKEAYSELKREVQVGKNAGDNNKIQGARATGQVVRESKTTEQVHQAVKDYRRDNTSNNGSANRSPNGTARKAQ